jgi:hypothetical protein
MYPLYAEYSLRNKKAQLNQDASGLHGYDQAQRTKPIFPDKSAQQRGGVTVEGHYRVGRGIAPQPLTEPCLTVSHHTALRSRYCHIPKPFDQ